jgi:hypothetical protein
MKNAEHKKTIHITDTPTAVIEYADHIIFLRLKEGTEFTIELIREQYRAQMALVKDDRYTVLIDATNNAITSIECMQYVADFTSPSRLAIAILTQQNLATLLLASFYINTYKPSTPTKVFKDESMATDWLKTQFLDR